MPYPVYLTNRTLNTEPYTVVADQVVNNTTSLSFVGKNYAGYAQLIAENFLHLMENFSNSTEPLTPVEGQLWYDNTTGINLLKVYDGTRWNPAGSIKKATTAPTLTESINGDLWVNPNTKQLFMFSGTSWDLIGPQYSSGLKTGPMVDSIVDSINTNHSVISLYSQNEQVAIISTTSFTPKAYTSGFAKVNRGITLSTNTAGIDYQLDSNLFTKLWGTAENADNLIVNGLAVSASNFLRSDQDSETTGSLNIRSNDGIGIGNDLSFKITSNDTPFLVNLTSKLKKSISFDFIDQFNIKSTGLFITAQQKVGIGNSAPTATLDVTGNILASSTLRILDTSNSSITTNGGLAVAKSANFGDITTFNNTVYLHKSIADISLAGGTGASVILPKYSTEQDGNPLFDIGSDTNKFRNIYAENFKGGYTGNLTGNVTGNVYGTATSLRVTRNFSITGDITASEQQFNGTADITLTATLSPAFISNKTAATSTYYTDEILTFRPSTGIQRTTKELFLSTIPAVPTGAIFPYAGIVPPSGYLFCDGSEVTVELYPDLFGVFQYEYRNKLSLIGIGTFALPDLRGRFPLGRDNMDNNLKVPTSTGLKAAGGKRNGTDPSNQPANRVRHSSASNLGDYSGSEAFGAPAVIGADGQHVTTDTTGQLNSIMNPYQTINYIIFTGVLQ